MEMAVAALLTKTTVDMLEMQPFLRIIPGKPGSSAAKPGAASPARIQAAAQ